MQRTLLVAVLVLGVSSLVFWALRVTGHVDTTPTAPVAAQASVTQSEAQLPANNSPAPTEIAAQGPVTALTSTGKPPPAAPSIDRKPVQPTQATQPPEPIAISPIHRKALDRILQLDPDNPLAKMHTQLLGESRDPEWSYAMEQQLGAFFLSRASQLGIEVPTIACRTSGCEVAMTSTLQPPLFDQLIFGMQREPWFEAVELQPMMNIKMDNTFLSWLMLRRR